MDSVWVGEVSLKKVRGNSNNMIEFGLGVGEGVYGECLFSWYHSHPQSPRSFWPVAGIEALGATISGMRHRCRLPETGWAEFGYFLCYFKMVAPRALVFRPLVKGNKALGTRLSWYNIVGACPKCQPEKLVFFVPC